MRSRAIWPLAVAVVAALAWLLLQQPIGSWSPSTWLTIGVLLVVLWVNAGLFGLFGRSTGQMAQHIPSLGLSVVGDSLYTVTAIGALIAAHRMHWPFTWSLLVQALALGALLVWNLMGERADAHATTVQRKEAATFHQLDTLKSWIRQQGPIVLRALEGNTELAARWRRVTDDIDMLFPTSVPSAPTVEARLRDELQQFLAMPSTGAIQRVEDTIRERKALRSTGDYQGFLS